MILLKGLITNDKCLDHPVELFDGRRNGLDSLLVGCPDFLLS